jgi:hypothetical protein
MDALWSGRADALADGYKQMAAFSTAAALDFVAGCAVIPNMRA